MERFLTVSRMSASEQKQVSPRITPNESENATPMQDYGSYLQQTVGNQKMIQWMKAAGKKPNHTGLPDRLKERLEAISGLDLSDVRVHYNSDKPNRLHALAYTQGNDIHLGPGQERYLPHEGWHVVQQKQGRVSPTDWRNGQAVNEDEQLEEEADKMGFLTPIPLSAQERPAPSASQTAGTANRSNSPIQMVKTKKGKKKDANDSNTGNLPAETSDAMDIDSADNGNFSSEKKPDISAYTETDPGTESDSEIEDMDIPEEWEKKILEGAEKGIASVSKINLAELPKEPQSKMEIAEQPKEPEPKKEDTNSRNKKRKRTGGITGINYSKRKRRKKDWNNTKIKRENSPHPEDRMDEFDLTAFAKTKKKTTTKGTEDYSIVEALRLIGNSFYRFPRPIIIKYPTQKIKIYPHPWGQRKVSDNKWIVQPFVQYAGNVEGFDKIKGSMGKEYVNWINALEKWKEKQKKEIKIKDQINLIIKFLTTKSSSLDPKELENEFHELGARKSSAWYLLMTTILISERLRVRHNYKTIQREFLGLLQEMENNDDLTLRKLFGDKKNAMFLATRKGGASAHRERIEQMKEIQTDRHNLINAISQAVYGKNASLSKFMIIRDVLGSDEKLNDASEETIKLIKRVLSIHENKQIEFIPDENKMPEGADSGKKIYIIHKGGKFTPAASSSSASKVKDSL